MSGRARGAGGQYKATDERKLQEMVRAVAAHARAAGDAHVTTRLFDGAREGAGHPDCPKASAVREHLNRVSSTKRSWQEWLAIIEDDSRDLLRTLEAGRRAQGSTTMPWEAEPAVPPSDEADSDEDEGLLEARPDVKGEKETDEQHQARVQERLRRMVHCALHAALTALSEPTMTGDQYALARERLVAAVPARAELLPTVNVLLRAVGGDWAVALELAGLPQVARPGHPGVAPQASLVEAGLPAPEAVVLFVQANGAWPSSRSLRRFCELADIALADHGLWSAVLEAGAALLHERGAELPPPEKRLEGSGEGRIRLPAERGEALPRRRERQRQTRDSCVAGVVVWLRQLKAGEASSRAAYRVFSVGRPECPAPSRFDQFGGWNSIKAEAVEVLAAEARGEC